MLNLNEAIARNKISCEYCRAKEIFPPFNSAHEGFAILKEEVDELWQEVKHGENPADLKAEAIQVGAMAMRFLVDVCGKEKTNEHI